MLLISSQSERGGKEEIKNRRWKKRDEKKRSR